ncbi:MAG: hypothetical protein L0210_04415 [Rhodospirillales bacterium]|nr:hypothetical protein [Rhodospirillales bacterium]
MRIFTIAKEPHKGKHIHVTRYVKTAEGVEIKIEHNIPTVAGKEIQWVQTVSSNRGFSVDCKMLTRVDPFGHGGTVNTVSLPAVPGICKADDLLPFYWTAADLAGGSGPGLSDAPSVPTPASGRTWTQFVTALTEVTGKNVHHLVAIAWGYDRMADGSVRVAVIRTPSTDEMRNHGKALKRMYPDYKYT